jgi:hypothetical protein
MNSAAPRLPARVPRLRAAANTIAQSFTTATTRKTTPMLQMLSQMPRNTTISGSGDSTSDAATVAAETTTPVTKALRLLTKWVFS